MPCRAVPYDPSYFDRKHDTALMFVSTGTAQTILCRAVLWVMSNDRVVAKSGTASPSSRRRTKLIVAQQEFFLVVSSMMYVMVGM